jgi:predicted nucleic acid-binding protein
VITAVDTNVLLDIFGADVTHGIRSANALRGCLREGALVACEAVWAETAVAFPGDKPFLDAMREIGVTFSPIEEAAALRASASWRRYRSRGGRRERVVADFLIGAHALIQCDRILTRDRGFYRDYFRELTIVDPGGRSG